MSRPARVYHFMGIREAIRMIVCNKPCFPDFVQFAVGGDLAPSIGGGIRRYGPATVARDGGAVPLFNRAFRTTFANSRTISGIAPSRTN